jgi:hypothetical protein
MKTNIKNGGQVKAPVQKSTTKNVPAVQKSAQVPADVMDDEVSSLMKKAQEADAKVSGTANVSFVSLANPNVQAMDATSELYIKGLKSGDYYIQSRHMLLGANVKCVPLAFISVYNHYDSLASPGKQPKFLGTVSKPDGDKFPLANFAFASGKKNFSVHRCPDGTFLQPAFWVPVFLPDFPDILDAVMTFKSTGNNNAKAWRKGNKSRPGAVASHMYTLGWEKLKSDANPKGWTVPKAEFVCDLVSEDGTYAFDGAKGILITALKLSMDICDKEEKNKLFIPFIAAGSEGNTADRDNRRAEDSLDYDTSNHAAEDDEDGDGDDPETF